MKMRVDEKETKIYVVLEFPVERRTTLYYQNDNSFHLGWRYHGQSPWYLHKIPSYAKASEGYPPSAKSAEAAILRLMNNSGTVYAFIHGQSPWSSA